MSSRVTGAISRVSSVVEDAEVMSNRCQTNQGGTTGGVASDLNIVRESAYQFGEIRTIPDSDEQHHLTHNPKVVGSNPPPATKRKARNL